jgi:hypothetical protein
MRHNHQRRKKTKRPTPCALDAGESARFTGIFPTLGMYPNDIPANPNTISAIKCQRGMSYNRCQDGIYV